jgi:hypothetical protein
LANPLPGNQRSQYTCVVDVSRCGSILEIKFSDKMTWVMCERCIASHLGGSNHYRKPGLCRVVRIHDRPCSDHSKSSAVCGHMVEWYTAPPRQKLYAVLRARETHGRVLEHVNGGFSSCERACYVPILFSIFCFLMRLKIRYSILGAHNKLYDIQRGNKGINILSKKSCIYIVHQHRVCTWYNLSSALTHILSSEGGNRHKASRKREFLFGINSYYLLHVETNVRCALQINVDR